MYEVLLRGEDPQIVFGQQFWNEFFLLKPKVRSAYIHRCRYLFVKKNTSEINCRIAKMLTNAFLGHSSRS